MAKLTDDQLRFIIDIEAHGAQGEINSLNAEIAKLEKRNESLSQKLKSANSELEKQQKRLAKLEKAGKQNTEEYRRLLAAINDNKGAIADLDKEYNRNQNIIDRNTNKIGQLTSSLKTSDLTMQQLRQRAAQLQRQLDLTSRSASPETYNKLRNELNETKQAMKDLGEKTSKMDSILNTAKGNILGLLGAKGIQYGIGVIKNGIGAIVNFESANASLAAVLGTTQDGVQDLTEDAKRLGAITEYSASQVTMMQTELAKLGFTAQEIMQSTEYILRFATATGSDIPSAAQLAGSALRAFHLDASETERVVSAMAVATTKSALDFTYLQNSMSTIAPVANAFGFSIEETTALLGTLANSGFDASSAATATRNILLNLADANGKLAKALGKPITSLDELAPALQKLKDEGVSLNEALELTDKRSVAAFETFLNGADSMLTLRDSITDVGDELTAMQETKLNTVEGSITLMKSAWEGLMLQFYNSKGIFKSIIDFFTGIINGLRVAISWLQNHGKLVKTIITLLVSYLAAGKAITAWRKIDFAALKAQATAMFTYEKAMILAKKANDALVKSLLKSPWGLIAMGIAGAVTALLRWFRRSHEASEEEKRAQKLRERTEELRKESVADMDSENTTLNALIGAITKTNDNEERRAGLIKKLQEQYPSFLSNLDKEKVTNEQLSAILSIENEQYKIRRELMLTKGEEQAYNEHIQDLEKARIDTIKEAEKAYDEAEEKAKRLNNINASFYNYLEKFYKRVGTKEEFVASRLKDIDQQINDTMDTIEKLQQKESDQQAAIDYAESIEGMTEAVAKLDQQIGAMKSFKTIFSVTSDNSSYINELLEKRNAYIVKIQAKQEEADKKAAEEATKAANEQAEIDDKAYKEQLKTLQESYAKRKAIIIKKEAEGIYTQEESKRKQLELAKEQSEEELNFAREHNRETADLQIKAAQAQMALNKDNYSKMEKDLRQWLDDSLRANKQALLDREITQEEADERARELQTQHLDKLKALMVQYGMDTTEIDKKIADNQIRNQEDAAKAEKKARAEIAKDAKKSRQESLKALKLDEEQELATLEKKYSLGLISETQYNVKRQQITETYAKLRLGIETIYAKAVENLDEEVVKEATEAVAEATRSLNQTLQDRLSEAREFTSELRDIFSETADALGDTLGGKLMGDMANAMDAITKFQDQIAAEGISTIDKVNAHVQMIGSVMSQVLSAASQITQQIFEMEANQLEAAKQKELAAVGDNAEEKERIEQEYAQKELDLKKKQADAAAAIQSASLWVNTAMGIATAWSTSMQLGPIAGPIMAAILTAALLATAGIQQANIIAQRDAIKNQTLESSGGSSAGINDSTASVSTTSIRDEYKPGGQGYSDGGYTGDGGVHEPAGVVHKGEYVVSQAELKNPAVVSMVRSIEGVRQSRKHGRTGEHGFADGGYTSEAPSTGELTETLAELRDEIQLLRTEKIHAEINYQEFKEIKSKMENLEKKGKL